MKTILIEEATERLQILNGNTYLEATYLPNVHPKDKVFFGRGDVREWSETRAKIEVIWSRSDVHILQQSDTPGLGLLKIGERQIFYYDKGLHPNPMALKNRVLDLMKFVLVGISQVQM